MRGIVLRTAAVSVGLSFLVTAAWLPRSAPAADAQLGARPGAPARIQRMVGTWDVQQRMWPAADAAPIALPPAVAKRQLVGGAFLREAMTQASAQGDGAFTREAWFDYNAVEQRYEYASIDTRAPQLMQEKSVGPDVAETGDLHLYGGRFVAPQWGDYRDAAFRYRLDIGRVEHGRQRVRLYLTPLAGNSPGEFLAFEYIYTRRR